MLVGSLQVEHVTRRDPRHVDLDAALHREAPVILGVYRIGITGQSRASESEWIGASGGDGVTVYAAETRDAYEWPLPLMPQIAPAAG